MPTREVKRAVLLLLCIFLQSFACGGKHPAMVAPEVITGSDHPPLLLRPGSLKFAVIGDSGRWSSEQRQTSRQLAAQHERFDFDFVLMLGDNNYGDGSAESYRLRFEEPFKPLLDAGVKFYAALGNHDVGPQWNYAPFNMRGHRYYTFERTAGVVPPLVGDLGNRVRFFALDTVNLDASQLAWLDKEMAGSKADWKIVFQHHPLYSSGRYALSSASLRRSLEQIFIEHQADVVFAGHEHLYERLHPQNGVMYFVNGAAGSVRTKELRKTTYLAKGYDADLSFMLAEIAGDTLYFQTVNRAGDTVDSGRIVRRPSR